MVYDPQEAARALGARNQGDVDRLQVLLLVRGRDSAVAGLQSQREQAGRWMRARSRAVTYYADFRSCG